METGQPTLLVVDDEPFYVSTLQRLLRHAYRVRSAGDGETTLALAASLQPDLILLDVKMPGLDGYQTCRRLKLDTATADIPVIFVSGVDDAQSKVQAFGSGGLDYITKPFHSAEVLARVATHLALRSLQRDLEGRVAERTTELAQANARLEREIAERRQAEEKFRGLLESAPEAMVIVDSRREIVIVNSAAEHLFAYPRQELLGRPVEMLMPERFRTGHAVEVEGYLAAPRSRPMGENLALFGRRRDGSEFPVAISLSPLATPEGPLVISAIRDITARKQAEAALRDLAAHRESVREEERKRIAGEIHDELGSLLTALKMDVSLLRMQLPEASPCLERVGQMRELTERTIHMVRQVATSLRPAALNLGLVPALEWLVEDFGRRTGISCALDAEVEVALGDVPATAVFRIVQESLTNVARHAAASHVDVAIARRGGGLELSVADDGRGFDPEVSGQSSFGLLGLRERAQTLGGRATVTSAPGRGTRVTIWIPLQEGPP